MSFKHSITRQAEQFLWLRSSETIGLAILQWGTFIWKIKGEQLLLCVWSSVRSCIEFFAFCWPCQKEKKQPQETEALKYGGEMLSSSWDGCNPCRYNLALDAVCWRSPVSCRVSDIPVPLPAVQLPFPACCLSSLYSCQAPALFCTQRSTLQCFFYCVSSCQQSFSFAWGGQG